MDRKRVLFIIPVALLITLALIFIFSDLSMRLSGRAVGDTYLEELKLYDCIEAGKWDQEMQNLKLTECPDSHPLMRGIGVAVTNDFQVGGRAYCCKADNIELYDCKEESLWEKSDENYKLTICPGERPIMKGIGIKVKNSNQIGGRVYCCKGKEIEIYSCAVTSFWQESNQDYKLTYCPEDRQILGGAGFNIKNGNQAGGKAYCCKGKLRLTEEIEEEVEVKEEETEVPSPEAEEETEKTEEAESFGKLFRKLFCKIFYFKNKDKYENCVG